MTTITKLSKMPSPDLGGASTDAQRTPAGKKLETGYGVDPKSLDFERLGAPKVGATGSVDLSWRPSVDGDALDALEDQMLEIAAAIIKGSAPENAEIALASMLDQLKTPIAETKDHLTTLRANMKQQHDTFSWWQRNINNPAAYDDKQAVEGKLAASLEQAQSIRGGARIALRVRQAQKPDRSPEQWQADQNVVHQEVVDARKSPAWSKEIADLARFQGKLKNESVAARSEASGRENDLDEYDEMTWFWQRSKFLDILTLGESDKGRVYRTGKTQAKNADDLADRFETVFGIGEDRLHGAINRLLIHEDPAGYGVTRANYDLVKPAYDALRRVQSQAETVLRRLSEVDDAISDAATVRMQEPSTTVTRRDQKGNYETVPNPDHDSWQWRLQQAESAIITAKNDASSALSHLNGLLPGLKQQLTNNNLRQYIGEVGSDLSTWNNWLGVFGSVASGFGGWASWSYDSSQVSSVRSDVHSLQMQLAPADAILTPRYQTLHSEVWKRIGERRSELVEKGQ